MLLPFQNCGPADPMSASSGPSNTSTGNSSGTQSSVDSNGTTGSNSTSSRYGSSTPNYTSSSRSGSSGGGVSGTARVPSSVYTGSGSSSGGSGVVSGGGAAQTSQQPVGFTLDLDKEANKFSVSKNLTFYPGIVSGDGTAITEVVEWFRKPLDESDSSFQKIIVGPNDYSQPFYMYGNQLSFNSDMFTSALPQEGMYYAQITYKNAKNQVMSTKKSNVVSVKIGGSCKAEKYMTSSLDLLSPGGNPAMYSSDVVAKSLNRFVDRSTSVERKVFFPISAMMGGSSYNDSYILKNIQDIYKYNKPTAAYSLMDFLAGVEGQVQALSCQNTIANVHTNNCGGYQFGNNECSCGLYGGDGHWTGDIRFTCHAGRWVLTNNSCQWVKPTCETPTEAPIDSAGGS